MNAAAPLAAAPLGPLPSAQPGGGPVQALEEAWGRARRALLRRCRPGHVARMAALRAGECDGCPHDVVDARDLKYRGTACGYAFPATGDAVRGRLPLARHGLAETLLGSGGLLALAAAGATVHPALAAPALLAAAFPPWFFRDPTRTPPTGDGLFVAPADGTVDDLGEVEHSPYLGGPAFRIGIFLSLLSVHVQRAPEAATVVGMHYRPGRRRATYRIGALEDNEQLWTVLATAAGARCAVRQVAGPAARRIVNTLRPGQQLHRGERFGLIKFGSRCELWLPRAGAAQPAVTLGARVRAGVTVLARAADPANTSPAADD